MYFFLRYGIVSIALLAWLYYQLVFKKREWNEIKDDGLAILFFTAVWVAISWLIFS
jgi:hypothetical protein